MQSDWYETQRPATYLVVPVGVDLARLQLPDEVRILLGDAAPIPLALDVEANTMAQRFHFVGVCGCLKHSGYCVLRT